MSCNPLSESLKNNIYHKDQEWKLKYYKLFYKIMKGVSRVFLI